jgi:hypothetical protein
MDCVVINLPSKRERWERLHTALNAMGIEHRRFDAIDGRTLQSEYDHLLVPGTRTFTPRGVMGCALSHYLVVQEFSQSAHDMCLILEDDALVAEGCKRHLERILAAAPPEWDMIKLASGPYRYDGPNVLTRYTCTTNFVARLVSRAGAKKLLAQRIAWPTMADVTPWFIPDFHTYVVNHRLATFSQTWKTTSISAQRYPVYQLNIRFVRFGDVEVSLGDFLVVVLAVLLTKVVVDFKKKPRAVK